MGLADLYREKSCVLSYELFPPKTDAGMTALSENLTRLLAFDPDFITCTYGAGGSTRDITLDALNLVREQSDVPLASHLTCVGATADELRDYLREAASRGIDSIVAIRGDAPKGEDSFTATEGGFSYAHELVTLIRAEFPQFNIIVGGYPETHPEASSAEADLDHLKHKVDCGADAVVTQLFYDNSDFYRFRDKCVARGINLPIIPGIMPVTSLPQIQRISALCGASLPEALVADLERCGDDQECAVQVGIDHATNQTRDLVANEVPGLHFYVLNKSRATADVLTALGGV